jgi:hypothetical protein
MLKNLKFMLSFLGWSSTGKSNKTSPLIVSEKLNIFPDWEISRQKED